MAEKMGLGLGLSDLPIDILCHIWKVVSKPIHSGDLTIF